MTSVAQEVGFGPPDLFTCCGWHSATENTLAVLFPAVVSLRKQLSAIQDFGRDRLGQVVKT
jgi:hypothetical protein